MESLVSFYRELVAFMEMGGNKQWGADPVTQEETELRIRLRLVENTPLALDYLELETGVLRMEQKVTEDPRLWELLLRGRRLLLSVREKLNAETNTRYSILMTT